MKLECSNDVLHLDLRKYFTYEKAVTHQTNMKELVAKTAKSIKIEV